MPGRAQVQSPAFLQIVIDSLKRNKKKVSGEDKEKKKKEKFRPNFFFFHQQVGRAELIFRQVD